MEIHKNRPLDLMVNYAKTPQQLIDDGRYEKVVLETGLDLNDFLKRNGLGEEAPNGIVKVRMIIVKLDSRDGRFELEGNPNPYLPELNQTDYLPDVNSLKFPEFEFGNIGREKRGENFEKILGELAKSFLRPANLMEFLHFGIQHPTEYREHSIFFIGSLRSGRRRDNALLFGNDKQRFISFNNPGVCLAGAGNIAFVYDS